KIHRTVQAGYLRGTAIPFETVGRISDGHTIPAVGRFYSRGEIRLRGAEHLVPYDLGTNASRCKSWCGRRSVAKDQCSPAAGAGYIYFSCCGSKKNTADIRYNVNAAVTR